jgi:hypothetical protein
MKSAPIFKVNLNPDEWDFRKVVETELEVAIEYEYNRENAALKEILLDWLKSRRNGINAISPDGRLAPWLAFGSDERAAIAGELSWKPRAIYISNNASSLAHKFATGRSYSHHFVSVDFKRKTAEIVSDFEKWVRNEAKKSRRLSGKASAPQWQKLKWLAAHRLHKAGLKYELSQAFVRDHRNKSRCESPDVLPVYASPGAWHDAITGAKSYIKLIAQK